MHDNIVHPDPVLTKVRPAQASMQPNLKVCEEILPMTRHLCTQAHNLKHRCAPNWRWGAQPAGRASRNLHAEDGMYDAVTQVRFAVSAADGTVLPDGILSLGTIATP